VPQYRVCQQGCNCPGRGALFTACTLIALIHYSSQTPNNS